MGLLGDSWDDPRTRGLLALGSALMGGGGGMQRLASGLGQYGTVMEEARRQAMRQQEIEAEGRRRDEEMRMRQTELSERINAAKSVAAEREAQMRAAQQAALLRGGYLSSVSGEAGPPEPFNAAKALMFLKPDEVKALEPPKPEKQATPPAAVQEYLYAVESGYKGTFEQWKLAMRPQGASVTLQTPTAIQNPDGTVSLIQTGNKPGEPAQIVIDPRTGKPAIKPPDAPKALTEAQAKASAFGSQMQAAEQELATTPLDMTQLWSQVDVQLAGGPTNVVAGANAQRARQAQEQWAEAFLRFKTGAASTEDEVKRNVRTYFPQPGDNKAVIDQKKRQRQQAVSDVLKAAGSGAASMLQGATGDGPPPGITQSEWDVMTPQEKALWKK